MIEADDFIGPAKAMGFRTWAGVPCSFLTPFINRVIDDPEMRYISSANEGDAVATASGAAVGGQPAVAMMQNSGLGNAISPLSSLNWVFRIPILLIITLRGEPGLPDEPQHELMGQITGDLLDKLQIPWAYFPRNADDVAGMLEAARWQMDRSARPYAFIMRKGSVAPSDLQSQWQPRSRPQPFETQGNQVDNGLPTRQQALQTVIANTPPENSLVIATTGFTGRELFALDDRPNQLYMVGSMGCATSFGLGLALAQPNRQLVVVDGDGAALMRLGNMATLGAYGPLNLQHLLLDNGVHDSTGGQATVSKGLSFAAIASACGYRHATESNSRQDLEQFLGRRQGPEFLQLHIQKGAPGQLPRPDQKPADVCRRLMAHMAVKPAWSNH
jgi:phosphonopyruvate decarboxylase